MVLVVTTNEYTLYRLPGGSRLLTFGRKFYRWDTTSGGAMRLTRIAPGIKPGKILHRGKYWLFNVVANDRFTPGIHLSMVVEPGVWEAYIISPELPHKIGDSCDIYATEERIANPRKRTAIM